MFRKRGQRNYGSKTRKLHWNPNSGLLSIVCKDRRELSFPRLFRQEEGMKKVWFEDKKTKLEPKLWFPFWGLYRQESSIFPDCSDKKKGHRKFYSKTRKLHKNVRSGFSF